LGAQALKTLGPAHLLYAPAVLCLLALCERVHNLPASMYLYDHMKMEPKPVTSQYANSVVYRGTLFMPGVRPRAIAVKKACVLVDFTIEESNQVSPKLLIDNPRLY
jgi:hypothetical protein